MSKVNQAMEDLLRYNAAILPQKRSVFNKSHGHTTTLDSGYIVPLMWDRVLPGDEKKIRYSGLARMATPKVPVMDEAKFDVACFFVPDRLVWEHAREFYGENKDASFNPDGEYIIPYLKPSQYMVDSENDVPGIGFQSLNDYFGFPVMNHYNSSSQDINENESFRVTSFLHRGYQLIWNYYYRNSSIQPALQLSTGDNVTDSEWNVIKHIRQACKFPDYFTSMLIEPQAGDDVLLPLGDKAPVVTGYRHSANESDGSAFGLTWRDSTMNANPNYTALLAVRGNNVGDYMTREAPTSESLTGGLIYPNNLWADLTYASAATINNLRAAITVQQLLEIDAMAGKRYQQILQAHFGVFTPDGTLQQPELCGLCRQNVGMRQVLQTSASSDGSPLGQTAAFSATNISNELICNKAFTEPGTLFVLGVVRPVVSYSQGLDPLLTKLHRYDHYWPVFDNLGNQPVPVSAIYLTDTGVADLQSLERVGDEVFGYAEAWTEYRIKQNRVSGFMRPDIPGSLGVWNYSMNFSDIPMLNSEFVTVHPETMERSLAFSAESGVSQFIVDSYFDYLDTKSMGVHSIPGLTRL